jgi:hypothetical protein
MDILLVSEMAGFEMTPWLIAAAVILGGIIGGLLIAAVVLRNTW